MPEKTPDQNVRPLARYSPLGDAVIKVAVHIKQVAGLDISDSDALRAQAFTKFAESRALHCFEANNPAEAMQVRRTLSTFRSLDVPPVFSATETIGKALDEFEEAMEKAGVMLDLSVTPVNRSASRSSDGTPDLLP